MNFKKLTLIGIACVSLPLMANADLISYNQTGEYSSVIVDSNGGICSGMSAHGITDRYSSTTTSTNEVKFLCGSKAPCVATIVMEGTKDAAKTCTGKTIGHATIGNLSNDIITDIKVDDHSYSIEGLGTNSITVKYTA